MIKSKKIIITLLLPFFVLMPGMKAHAESGYKPVVFEMEKLDNGLQVIYSIDKSAPVVATVVHYNVGSKDENPQRTGFAHFFEHLMFEGTNDIPRSTIDKYVEEAGGWLNAHTSFDETVYKFRVPSNEIKLALWIEAQRMRGLLVDTMGVETQRGVVKEERKMRNDNTAYGTMNENMFKRLFHGSSYEWNPIGSEEHINKATIQEFKNFYNNFYEPNNAVLAIVGDFNIDDVKKYVRDYFGQLKKAGEPNREPFVMPALTKSFNDTVYDNKAQLPAVFVGYRGPKMGESDDYILTLFTQIISNGESSRLYKNLVDKGLAIQARGGASTLQSAGLIMFNLVPAMGKQPGDILEKMTAEIEKIAKDGVTDEELTKAKNIVEDEIISSNKNTLDKAQSLARCQIYFKDPGFFNKELELCNKVTKEDIKTAAAKYFTNTNRVVLYYLPKSQAAGGKK